MKVGSESTTLVVIRGNSASGKSTIAAGIRAECGPATAIVGQDHLRRVVLKEKDKPGAVNIGLIDLVTRYALDQGYTTVLEGIQGPGKVDVTVGDQRGSRVRHFA